MLKRAGVGRVVFALAWVAGLGCISAILVTDRGAPWGFTHYLKLYGVGVLWFVFFLFVFGENRVSGFRVVPRQFDKAILFLVLGAVEVALLVEVLRMAVGLRVFPALLLGGVCAALFGVIRDLLRAKDV